MNKIEEKSNTAHHPLYTLKVQSNNHAWKLITFSAETKLLPPVMDGNV